MQELTRHFVEFTQEFRDIVDNAVLVDLVILLEEVTHEALGDLEQL